MFEKLAEILTITAQRIKKRPVVAPKLPKFQPPQKVIDKESG